MLASILEHLNMLLRVTVLAYANKPPRMGEPLRVQRPSHMTGHAAEPTPKAGPRDLFRTLTRR